MAEALEALATHNPAKSAVFIDPSSSENNGKYLFLHHALYAVCADSELATPDEQVRGLTLGMWDGLSDPLREFWTKRAATAWVVRDRAEFLLTDRSTQLSIDHCERALDALDNWKKASMGGVSGDSAVTEVDALEPNRKQNGIDKAQPDVDLSKTERQLRKSSEDQLAVEGPATDDVSIQPVTVESSTVDIPSIQSVDSAKSTQSESVPVIDTIAASAASETGDCNVNHPSKPGGNAAIKSVSGSAHNNDETSTDQEKLLNTSSEDTTQASLTKNLSPPDNTDNTKANSSRRRSQLHTEASVSVSIMHSASAERTSSSEPTATSFNSEAPSHIDSSQALPSSDDATIGDTADRTEDKAGEIGNDSERVDSILSSSSFSPAHVEYQTSPLLDAVQAIEHEQATNALFEDDESEHNESEHNESEHNESEHNESEHNESEHNESEHNESNEVITDMVGPANAPEEVAVTTTKVSWADLMDEEADREAAEREKLGAEVSSLHLSSMGSDGGAPAPQLSQQTTSIASQYNVEGELPDDPLLGGWEQVQKKKSNGKKANKASNAKKKMKPMPEPLLPRSSMPKKVQLKSTASLAVNSYDNLHVKNSNPWGQRSATAYDWSSHSSLGALEKPFSEPKAEADDSKATTLPESDPPAWEEAQTQAPQLPRKSPITAFSEPPQPSDDEGRKLFLRHALDIVCEDMEMYEPDDWAVDVALLMWDDLPRASKRSWSDDACGGKATLRVDSSYLYSAKRFSGKTNLYRVELIKALADRNDGELKALQKEYDEIRKLERRMRKAQKERTLREAARYVERPTPRPSGPLAGKGATVK